MRVSGNAKKNEMEEKISKIKYHYENKKYCKILRKFAKNSRGETSGFIVDYSENFIIIQESNEFDILGYFVFPISTIEEIRYNNSDKYYEKILKEEKLIEKVGLKHKIELKNWQTIFESIKDCGLNVIIENENPEDETFDIGPITKITGKSVFINYFDAKGFLDDEETEIDWDKITLVKFDDRYVNIFSKYLRKRKQK